MAVAILMFTRTDTSPPPTCHSCKNRVVGKFFCSLVVSTRNQRPHASDVKNPLLCPPWAKKTIALTLVISILKSVTYRISEPPLLAPGILIAIPLPRIPIARALLVISLILIGVGCPHFVSRSLLILATAHPLISSFLTQTRFPVLAPKAPLQLLFMTRKSKFLIILLSEAPMTPRPFSRVRPTKLPLVLPLILQIPLLALMPIQQILLLRQKLPGVMALPIRHLLQ